MSVEAMKQALEVLEMYMVAGTKYPSNLLEMELAPKAYDSLRRAIEQAENQEPVAYMDNKGYICNHTTNPERWIPLYTAPPQRE
jgi:hypothetical protein